jgi:hypothetical protein
MERMKISLIGLSEVRWIGTGSKDLKHHKFIYSGGSHHERGVGIVLQKKLENISRDLGVYWAGF